jgi:thioesterase domain-containing protein
MDPAEITAYIHEHIPLTWHLGAQVQIYDGKKVVVAAPLAPNLNHRNTAFGGSISALGILSGWALIFMKLREYGIRNRLVIQKSSFDFLELVADNFTATSALPSEEEWQKFLRILKKHGRARITIMSMIESPAGTGGTHKGTYVALLLERT